MIRPNHSSLFYNEYFSTHTFSFDTLPDIPYKKTRSYFNIWRIPSKQKW